MTAPVPSRLPRSTTRGEQPTDGGGDGVLPWCNWDHCPEPGQHRITTGCCLIAPCPTCMVGSRETVGMVCQTCGTDYGGGDGGREVEAFTEAVAADVHAAWMQAKRDQGITSRPSADGIEQMVDYTDLPDHLRELDRATVRAVFASPTLAARLSPDRQKLAEVVHDHIAVFRSATGPIAGCWCGKLRLGESYTLHVADAVRAALLAEQPTDGGGDGGREVEAAAEAVWIVGLGDGYRMPWLEISEQTRDVYRRLAAAALDAARAAAAPTSEPTEDGVRAAMNQAWEEGYQACYRGDQRHSPYDRRTTAALLAEQPGGGK